MTHPILDLQAADTVTDQLRHRNSHLPEQAQLDVARSALADWERRRDVLQRRLAELESEIGRCEAGAHEIDVHRIRLERQLKTVIAPREAEALMHEIALLNERRNGLDDAELMALEEQATVDDDLSALGVDEPAIRGGVEAAEEEVARAQVAIADELAAIADRHEHLRDAVDAGQLRRYDELRGHQMVAAAALNGHRCEGCHLDLSATEIDEVRALSARNGLGECPHCGRLLVV